MSRALKDMFRRKGRRGWYYRVYRGGKDRLVALGADLSDACAKVREIRGGRLQSVSRLTVGQAAD